MAGFNSSVLLFATCLIATAWSYNTSLEMCGSPSNPQKTSGHECTGALFNLVDINQYNTLKTEAGCVAGMLGLSTQLQGYHCLSFKNCPGAGCTCEVRQGCGSSQASTNNTASCLYGVQQASECPADVPAPAGATSSSSARSLKGSAILIGLLVFVNCLLGANASYNTSLEVCGSPSSPQKTSGYECTGALFNLVDINKFNSLKNEAGCVAGMLGLSTQLQGYHCLSFKNCPGQGCTCEVRQGCSSSQASTNNTAACLYGVQQASECPADAPASQGVPSSASSANSIKSLAMMIVSLFFVAFASAAFHVSQ